MSAFDLPMPPNCILKILCSYNVRQFLITHSSLLFVVDVQKVTWQPPMIEDEMQEDEPSVAPKQHIPVSEPNELKEDEASENATPKLMPEMTESQPSMEKVLLELLKINTILNFKHLFYIFFFISIGVSLL